MFVFTLKMMRLIFLHKESCQFMSWRQNRPICLDLVLSRAASSCLFSINSWFVLKWSSLFPNSLSGLVFIVIRNPNELKKEQTRDFKGGIFFSKPPFNYHIILDRTSVNVLETKELLLSSHSGSKTYCLNVSVSCFRGSHVFVLDCWSLIILWVAHPNPGIGQ